jgi:predicted ATP-grasp superfamily ATP-dependent carboligase
LKVIITEINSKNSLALQRELSKYPDIFLIGVAKPSESILLSKLHLYCNEYQKGELYDVISNTNPDLIIPVGGKSVTQCMDKYKKYCLLPTAESFNIAINKDLTSKLNVLSGVNYPEINQVYSLSDVLNLKYRFDIVLKSRNETKSKFDPIYIQQNAPIQREQIELIESLFYNNIEVIAQQRVFGVGRGFFCIAKDGIVYTYYMHERIREYPVSGGSSTAAKSIYCKKLLSISNHIVSYLKWTGPLMIEFKYNVDLDEYYLIELNPKFWGSLDLSYAIGLNFGRVLIDLFNNKKIDQKNSKYLLGVSFYWILDGDIINIVRTRKYLKFLDYFKSNAKTNLFTNIFATFYKLIVIFRSYWK